MHESTRFRLGAGLAGAVALFGLGLAHWDVQRKGAGLLALDEGHMVPADMLLSGLLFVAIGMALVGALAWRLGFPFGRLSLALLPGAVGWLRFVGLNDADAEEFIHDRTFGEYLVILGMAWSAGLMAALLPGARRLALAGTSAAASAPMRRDAAALAVAAVAVAYSIAMFLFSSWRLDAYIPGMLDLGMYDQLHWSILHYTPFHTTVFELPWQVSLRRFGYNYHAEHFMPILYLTAVPYWFWQSPKMLLLVHSVLIGLAAIPLYGFVLHITRSRPAALIMSLSWLMHPLIQLANLKDFHPDALIGFFVFAAMWAFVARRPVATGLALVGAMACKEDVALMVVFLGVFLAVVTRQWMWAGAIALGGIVWFLGVAGPVMKAAVAGSDDVVLRHLDRFSLLIPEGTEPPRSIPGLAAIVLTNPMQPIGLLGEWPRITGLMKLLAPLGLLVMIYPASWILAVPAIGAHIFSNWSMQAQFDLYHASAVLPWIYVGLAYGLAGWMSPAPDSTNEPETSAQAPEPSGAAQQSPRVSPGAWCPRGAVSAFLLATLATSALLSFKSFGHLPPGDHFSWSDYRRFSRSDGSDALVAQVPPLARVAAVNELGPHLTRRPYIYLLPDLPESTEYVALDAGARVTYPMAREHYVAVQRDLLTNGAWGVVWSHPSGQYLLKRGADDTANAALLERLGL